jgi:hypothetical protein
VLIAKALGIGRPAETNRRSPKDTYLFRSLHLIPWHNRFRFGYVLGWNGPFYHNAIGWKGSDWENGNWLGGMSWSRHIGPIAICRSRRRGSLVSDLRFERMMGCNCRHLSHLWVKSNGKIKHSVLCMRKKDED